MSLSIDPARAFLLPSELRRLAEAVRDAGPHDESKWVEWKSTLPLGTAPARIHLVKHILGFANRSPEVAARWAGGHAYLLVGVSSGEVPGVTSIDHNEMEQDLKPYIGPDLVWHPEYVKLDGKDVLIVVVDPPKYGDPIHYLRKSLPIPDGKGTAPTAHTVFIRRNAQTARAEPGDWQMLLQRFAASQDRLAVTVATVQQQIERVADYPEHTKVNLERGRERLQNARYRPSRGSSPFARVIAGSETRSREEYAAEVDAYMRKLEERLRQRFMDEVTRHKPGGLGLTLVNRGDRPFRRVRVTLDLRADGQLHCLAPVDDDPPEFSIPRPPRPYGAGEEPMLQMYQGIYRHQYNPAAAIESIHEAFRGWEAESLEDGLRIRFADVDLRPRETLELPHVPLLVVAAIGTELIVDWSAAGLSAEGELRGQFAMPVVPSTLEPLTGEELGEWGQNPAVLESETSAGE